MFDSSACAMALLYMRVIVLLTLLSITFEREESQQILRT
jgi:hypothetical protein